MVSRFPGPPSRYKTDKRQMELKSRSVFMAHRQWNCTDCSTVPQSQEIKQQIEVVLKKLEELGVDVYWGFIPRARNEEAEGLANIALDFDTAAPMRERAVSFLRIAPVVLVGDLEKQFNEDDQPLGLSQDVSVGEVDSGGRLDEIGNISATQYTNNSYNSIKGVEVEWRTSNESGDQVAGDDNPSGKGMLSVDTQENENDKEEDVILVRFDGACRGNPGPGAVGAICYWTKSPEKHLLFPVNVVSCGMDGETTNNIAEYYAAWHAVRLASEEIERLNILQPFRLCIQGDSALVINQLNGD
jgi:hypothetical protein